MKASQCQFRTAPDDPVFIDFEFIDGTEGHDLVADFDAETPEIATTSPILLPFGDAYSGPPDPCLRSFGLRKTLGASATSHER